MKAHFLAGALALASVLHASIGLADDAPFDDDAMRAALRKHYRDSAIIGGVTHAVGVTGAMIGIGGVMEPEIYSRLKRVGYALLPFGILQFMGGTWPLLEGTIGLGFFEVYDKFGDPADFIARHSRNAKINLNVLRVALIADLVITGLSIPLLFPNERFREWKGFAVLMVAEGIFSAATGYAHYRVLDSYINSLDRFGKYISPPMGPQSARPIVFDVKFAF